ncbi:A-kinase anchor protein 10, mitochondrial [Poecilia formosa]|uniref:A-kinase anchor protein 10, mitochondrial n=1 Tax=Poecilia formosa TaxID=48698 RepID=UPI0007B816E6|nr:PREDICTED: A-kinase anchor protein 10, mitochondrial [Poecilia formosa]
MSFFKRKAKSKEPERVTDAKVNKVPVSPHSPSHGLKNHNAVLDAAGPSHMAISAISANMDSFARGRTAILKKQPSHMEAAHFGDLGHSSVNYQPQETRSRMSKTVDQVLRDNVAMPHFLHCMEQRGADHLVRFWLEAENFRSASWSRVRAQNLNSVKHSSLAEPVPVSPDGPELDQNAFNDPALHNSRGNPSPLSTRRDSSSGEAKPSRADTPSRQAPSRTGTPSKGHPNNTLQDFSDTLMKSDSFFFFFFFFCVRVCVTSSVTDVSASLVCPLISRHFTEFLRSHHFCKYQIEVLTSGSVFLADILFCESALFYFSEYMEKEEAMNILQFWLAADNFQNQLAAKKGQYDGQEAQNDAMILYDKYFSLQATNPLGFGDSVRMEIESNICREGGPLPDCFTTPLRQAWTTMEKVYLPGFLSSNIYYKYLSDLINSVRGDEFVNGKGQGQGQGVPADGDRPGLNAGGESSQVQQGAKKAAIKILKNFDEAITVDVASLDPEMLYQRPYAGMKAQEEMAWKIAKMIVNDVVHQSNHDSPGKSTKL